MRIPRSSMAGYVKFRELQGEHAGSDFSFPDTAPERGKQARPIMSGERDLPLPHRR